MFAKLFRSVLFLTAALILAGCGGAEEKSSEEEEISPIVLEGTVSGVKNGRVQLRQRIGPYTYADEQMAKDSIEQGRFRMSFRKEEPGYVSFVDSTQEILLYLFPGDSLRVRKSLEGSFSFEGKGAVRNRYIQKRKRFQDSIAQSQGNIFDHKKDTFLQLLEEREKIFKTFRERHFESKGEKLEERFKRLERLRDRIDLGIIRFSYPDIYRYENPNDSIDIGKKYWSFLDSMDLSDPLLLHVPQYLSFAYDVANKYTLDNKGEQKSMSYREILFRTIVDEFRGKVKEAVLTYFMLEQIRYSKGRGGQDLLERYRKEVDDPEMESFVEKKYEKSGEVSDSSL